MQTIEIYQKKSIFSKIFSIVRYAVFVTALLYFFVYFRVIINNGDFKFNTHYKILFITVIVIIINFFVFYVYKLNYNASEKKLYVYSRLLIPRITRKRTYKIKEIKWVFKYIQFEKEKVLEIKLLNGKKKRFWPYHLALLDEKEIDEFIKQVRKSLDENNMR